jgi:hypothetical protein
VVRKVLTVVFERAEDLLAQRAHIPRGGFFVPMPQPPPEPFSEVRLVIVAPAGGRVELAARVVHLAPGAGVGLAFLDAIAAREALEPLLALAGRPSRPDAGPPRVQWEARPTVPAGAGPQPAAPSVRPAARAPAPDPAPPDESTESPEPEPQLGEGAATLFDRIRAMSTSEKMKLAQHGDRSARILLMKDVNKSIHTFVIQNPNITLDEVRYIAGYRQTNPEVLKMIGENRDWLQNPRVVAALVGNPKTPTTTAVKLLEKLPLGDLRRIAKSDNYPKAVTLAARKKVLGDS